MRVQSSFWDYRVQPPESRCKVLIIAVLFLSGVFTHTELEGRLLRGNDLSYGLYNFHMPVYHFVLEVGWFRESQVAWLAFVFAVLIAATSLKLVEKPSIRLKSYSLRRVSSMICCGALWEWRQFAGEAVRVWLLEANEK